MILFNSLAILGALASYHVQSSVIYNNSPCYYWIVFSWDKVDQCVRIIFHQKAPKFAATTSTGNNYTTTTNATSIVRSFKYDSR